MAIQIQKLIDEAVKKPRAKKAITSWHISKLGSCLRGVYLERRGYKPDKPIDDRTLRVFDVGNKTEDWMVELIKSVRGVEAETQIRVEDKKLGVSGYIDLKLKQNGETELYEIKSKHSRAFWYMKDKAGGPNRHHEYQLWTYLWLSGIKKGSLVYVSKDDLSILQYPVLRNDKQLKKEVFEQLEILNDCLKNNLLPPLPDKKSWQHKYCRFHQQCLAIEEVKTIKLWKPKKRKVKKELIVKKRIANKNRK